MAFDDPTDGMLLIIRRAKFEPWRMPWTERNRCCRKLSARLRSDRLFDVCIKAKRSINQSINPPISHIYNGAYF